MYNASRSATIGSTNRLQNPVAWSRKRSDSSEDVEAGERTPLLVGRSPAELRADKKPDVRDQKVNPCALMLMLTLIAFLLLGVIIAVYLLLLQIDHPWPVSFPFFLVERHAWWPYPVGLEARPLNRSAVNKVLVLHTRSESCSSQSDCLRYLQHLQEITWTSRKENIAYNFLIGADGKTYEARGWKNQHGFTDLPGQNDSLVVGLIGNFTDRKPSDIQLAEVKAFITESIRRFNLSAQYLISGVVNGTIAPNDGAALYGELQHWPRWTGALIL